MRTHKPVVWLPACHRHLDLADPGGYTVLADRYAGAVTALGLQPVLFPMAGAPDVPDLLPLVDGVLLTGSPSNVDASRFGAAALPGDLLDLRRDALTMALVPAAIAARTPLFGVCRGLQEMNVALGGSLHQQLHSNPDLMDHREPDDEELAVQFAARHEVRLAPGSAFARWAGGTTAQVNSLHGQGIKRLGEGLVAKPSRRTGWRGCAGGPCAGLRFRRAMASRVAARDQSLPRPHARGVRAGLRGTSPAAPA